MRYLFDSRRNRTGCQLFETCTDAEKEDHIASAIKWNRLLKRAEYCAAEGGVVSTVAGIMNGLVLSLLASLPTRTSLKNCDNNAYTWAVVRPLVFATWGAFFSVLLAAYCAVESRAHMALLEGLMPRWKDDLTTGQKSEGSWSIATGVEKDLDFLSRVALLARRVLGIAVFAACWSVTAYVHVILTSSDCQVNVGITLDSDNN